jgi:hypothetical protein
VEWPAEELSEGREKLKAKLRVEELSEVQE